VRIVRLLVNSGVANNRVWKEIKKNINLVN